MKSMKLRSFSISWKENGESKSETIIAKDFDSAIKVKFGNEKGLKSLPDITSVYSNEVTAYIE